MCSSAYLRHLFYFSTFPKSHAGHTHPDKVAHWQCLEETDTQSSQLPWILPTAKPTHMHYSSCLCKGTRLLFSIFNVPNCQSKTGSPLTDTFAFQRHLGFAFPRIQVQKLSAYRGNLAQVLQIGCDAELLFVASSLIFCCWELGSWPFA